MHFNALLLTTLLALSGLFKEVLPPLQDLVTLSTWMTGSFSSQEQAALGSEFEMFANNNLEIYGIVNT
jgi:hypothetical protein